MTIIEVDYGNLPIKCRFCQSIDHLINTCPAIAKKKIVREKENTENSFESSKKEGGGRGKVQP
jgi:hypothetical protein